MAKPKLKKAQSGGNATPGVTFNGTSKKKIGPILGIGIPVAGMAAAGANMIKNAVKRRKERKATEEETRKALENAKSQRTKKSQVPAPFDKRKAEKAKKVVAKTGGTAKYKMGGVKKYQPGGGTGTPFQEYMKTPGAVASDTTFNKKNTPNPFLPTKVPANPKLKDAFEKTFGMDIFQRGIGEDYYWTAPENDRYRNYDEYHRRMGPKRAKGGAAKATYKKGGLVKAQDGKMIKSNKVRSIDMNDFGPSTASVSKTKRNGSTVTKSINTNQGYVPTASKTKTVTDAKGNTTSSTKDIGWNSALRKQGRISRKVGRNPEDMYKTGGMVNPNAKVSKQTTPGSKGVTPKVNPKATTAKRATGRVGGTSTAPKTAIPKAQMGATVGNERPRAIQPYKGFNPERPKDTPTPARNEGQKKLRGIQKIKANRMNNRIKKG